MRYAFHVGRITGIEEGLRDARDTDCRLLAFTPVFKNCSTKFMARVFGDSDVQIYFPGERIIEAGTGGQSMLVVLGGQVRGEHKSTLFRVDYAKGDWCGQNVVLGNDFERTFDLLAESHAVVLEIHRHVLLQALQSFPSARKKVEEMQLWTKEVAGAGLRGLSFMKGSSDGLVRFLEQNAALRFFSSQSVMVDKGNQPEALFFLSRGQARLEILG